MATQRYYAALAERIFHNGLNLDELTGIVRLKKGKSQRDLIDAISSGGFEGVSDTPPLQTRLEEVFTINRTAYDRRYGEPDRD